MTIEEAKRPLSTIQTVKAQLGIPRPPQGLMVFLCLRKKTMMKEAPKMTVSDPNSSLPSFLTRFDSLELNSLPTSHFHSFGPPFVNFLQFSMPTEGLLLLEGLLKVHWDFTSGFRRCVFLGNILVELFYAVLVSLKDTSLDSLFDGRLLEWKGVVQYLMEAKLNLSFLLEYLRSLAHALFQRKASRDLDVEIVAIEEALARAYKVLQDLKNRKQQSLSFSATSSIFAVPLEGSLLAGLIP